MNKEKMGKDEENMSFVGMKICNDGIVSFADSKSSKCRDSQLVADIKRGPIRKVFKHENFIIATWGMNEILINNNTIEWIEERIEILLAKSTEKNDFLQQLSQYLLHSQTIQEFHFLIGYKDTH